MADYSRKCLNCGEAYGPGRSSRFCIAIDWFIERRREGKQNDAR